MMLTRVILLCIGLAAIAGFLAAGHDVLDRLMSFARDTAAASGGETTIVVAVSLLAASAVARSVKQSIRESSQNQLQPEKADTYRLFVELYAVHFKQGRSLSELSEAAETLDRLLVLYGSPAVIRAHAALRPLANGTPTTAALSTFGHALLAIRKDLGMKRAGLMPIDLQQLVFPRWVEPDVASAAKPLSTSVAQELPHISAA